MAKGLPWILCLHGGGVNIDIFQIQIRKLRTALRRHFRLAFVNAPFPSQPGPGVSPFFDECGEFWSWLDPKILRNNNAERLNPYGPEVHKTIETALSELDDAPVVGVLSFSQGGIIATRILLDASLSGGANWSTLKFGILLCADYSPRFFEDFWNSNDLSYSNQASCSLVRIPTVHVHGMKDPWLHCSRELQKDLYDPELTRVIEFDGAHHVPHSIYDIQKISAAVLQAYGNPDSRRVPLVADVRGDRLPSLEYELR